MNQKKFSALIAESQAEGKPKRANRFMLFISILLAGIFLYLALHDMDWRIFFATIKHARYSYIFVVLVLSNFNYLFRALRWRVLLLNEKHIPVSNVFWANMVGYLGNNVLPTRAGELMRAAYVSRKENISLSFIIATGITERLVDLAVLVVIGAGSLFFVESFPKYVHDALKSFVIVAVTGIAVIFMLPLFHGLSSRVISSLSFLGKSLQGKLNGMLAGFVEGIKVISKIERGLPFLLFTALIWLMDGIGTVIFAFAFNESLTLAQAFFFIAALGLSSAIPSTPGYVGVYQFVAVTVLVPFGIARESALALALISQALNLLIVSCWGGGGLWIGTRNALA